MTNKKISESDDYTGDYTKNAAYHTSDKNDIDDARQENQDLREQVKELEKKLKRSNEQAEQRYNDLVDSVSTLAKRVHSKTNQLSEHVPKTDGEIDSISADLSTDGSVGTLSADLSDLDLRFQLHENSTTDGHLIWKINDFENRTNDAIIGKIRALHSAPCFTEKYGYKFCLRLYLHGDGMGRGTHLSLFLVIMKSEYDDILQWPFQQKIKFKLINQNDRSKDHVEQMSPSKDSSSFQKPKKDMNIASGCPLFISLDRLQPEGFLKNGNLFVEVKIE